MGAKLDLSSLSAALGSSASQPAAAPRRAPAAERAEQHRQKGNEWFRLRAYEEAFESYSAALNAAPGDVRVLSNRSACCAALGRFAGALSDADGALAHQPGYARAHSRRGLALWHLGRFHEAAEAYGRACELEPHNEDAQEGLARAVASGGDARRAQAERQRAKMAAAKPPPSEEERRAAAASLAAAAHRRLAESAESERVAYEARLSRVRTQRREALQLWRKSTGTQLHAPEIERQTSIRVDLFGHLRGPCPRNGCKMWRRDIATAAHWSDTRVLTCEDCGLSNDSHLDCGPYEIDDPTPPRAYGQPEDEIAGVHRFGASAGM